MERHDAQEYVSMGSWHKDVENARKAVSKVRSQGSTDMAKFKADKGGCKGRYRQSPQKHDLISGCRFPT